jgi:hypothetical protein
MTALCPLAEKTAGKHLFCIMTGKRFLKNVGTAKCINFNQIGCGETVKLSAVFVNSLL